MAKRPQKLPLYWKPLARSPSALGPTWSVLEVSFGVDAQVYHVLKRIFNPKMWLFKSAGYFYRGLLQIFLIVFWALDWRFDVSFAISKPWDLQGQDHPWVNKWANKWYCLWVTLLQGLWPWSFNRCKNFGMIRWYFSWQSVHSIGTKRQARSYLFDCHQLDDKLSFEGLLNQRYLSSAIISTINQNPRRSRCFKVVFSPSNSQITEDTGNLHGFHLCSHGKLQVVPKAPSQWKKMVQIMVQKYLFWFHICPYLFHGFLGGLRIESVDLCGRNIFCHL